MILLNKNVFDSRTKPRNSQRHQKLHLLLLCQLADVISRSTPWHKTGAIDNHAQLGLTDKGRAIKGLVVCNGWELEPRTSKRSGHNLLSTVPWGMI